MMDLISSLGCFPEGGCEIQINFPLLLKGFLKLLTIKINGKKRRFDRTSAIIKWMVKLKQSIYIYIYIYAYKIVSCYLREAKPLTVNQQCLVYKFECDLWDAGYVAVSHAAICTNVLKNIKTLLRQLASIFATNILRLQNIL